MNRGPPESTLLETLERVIPRRRFNPLEPGVARGKPRSGDVVSGKRGKARIMQVDRAGARGERGDRSLGSRARARTRSAAGIPNVETPASALVNGPENDALYRLMAN